MNLEDISKAEQRFTAWKNLLQMLLNMRETFNRKNSEPATHLLLPVLLQKDILAAVAEFGEANYPSDSDKDSFFGMTVIWAEVNMVKVGILQ